MSLSRKRLAISGAVALLVVGGGVGTLLATRSSGVVKHSTLPFSATLSNSAPSAGTPICGQPILDSPYSYTGSATTFTSGEYAGLPTFGAPGTDFPNDTSGVIIPSGTDSGIYNAASTLYFLEPGSHTIDNSFIPGTNAAYVGGYSGGSLAVINGGGSGTNLWQGKAPGIIVDYLTVENFWNYEGEDVVNNDEGASRTFEYDTIGPNNPKGQASYDGYGIGLGNNNTLKYDCITGNSEGGFNASGGPGHLLTGVVVSNNEIANNSLGDYPDNCGCAAGGKFFWSTNFVFTDNYVHHNYGAGVWGDFNNAGADIANNYISSNWGFGIAYEASYNANISANALVGNGWASDGTWPVGTCYGGISCAGGLGPVTGAGGGFPYPAIYLPNSGGTLATVSDYSGHLYVQNNVLTDNFGGIISYADPTRFAGGPFQCHATLQAVNTTYYQNWDQEQASDATTTSGSTAVTSAAGFATFFTNPGCSNPGPVTTPTVGMYVYGTGIPVGDTIATVTSANAFTLTAAATATGTGDMTLSTPGGCGLYDLYGSSPGAITGSPPADYYDNCFWAALNVAVSGNTFTLDSSVSGCTSANLCGVNGEIAYNAGIDAWWHIYQPATVDNIAKASVLNNVWSGNTYVGPWAFEAGFQGPSGAVSFTQWQGAPYGQDSGSTYNASPTTTTVPPTTTTTTTTPPTAKVSLTCIADLSTSFNLTCVTSTLVLPTTLTCQGVDSISPFILTCKETAS